MSPISENKFFLDDVSLDLDVEDLSPRTRSRPSHSPVVPLTRRDDESTLKRRLSRSVSPCERKRKAVCIPDDPTLSEFDDAPSPLILAASSPVLLSMTIADDALIADADHIIGEDDETYTLALKPTHSESTAINLDELIPLHSDIGCGEMRGHIVARKSHQKPTISVYWQPVRFQKHRVDKWNGGALVQDWRKLNKGKESD